MGSAPIKIGLIRLRIIKSQLRKIIKIYKLNLKLIFIIANANNFSNKTKFLHRN